MFGCHKCTQLDTTAIPLKALFKAARRRIAVLIWHTVNAPLVDHWGFYKISSKQGQAFEFVLAIIKRYSTILLFFVNEVQDDNEE